jgi:hypothetical protein
MRKILKYLKNHWREDYSWQSYVAVAFILIVLIFLNYKMDFEDSVLDTRNGFRKFFAYLFFFSIPYFIVLLITCDYQRNNFWKLKPFYVKSIFALSVLSLDSSLPFLRNIISNVNPEIYFWAYKVVVNMISLLTVMLPLWLFYIFYDKSKTGFYGLNSEKFDYRPYLNMLLIMLPVLIAATFLPGFLKQYPMYKQTGAHLFLDVPEWVTVVIYEFVYGLDFLTVELLFRGFFVIGMIHLTGRKSVLAMAVIYCMLHFGKPAGEAISSIFGGYILGVIAYETKSIWGGVIVHVGIAWMMELVSALVKAAH